MKFVWKDKVITSKELGFLGAVLGLTLIVVAGILHYIGEPFTFSSHWISNLGVGPNGSGFIFSTGLIIAGSLFLPLIYEFPKWLPNKRWISQLTVAFATISMVNLFMVAIFDMDNFWKIHVITASLFFLTAAIFTLLSTFAMMVNNKGSIQQYGITIILFVLIIVFIPIYTEVSEKWYLKHNLEGNFQDWLLLLNTMETELGPVRQIEWIACIVVFIWLIQSSVHCLKNMDTEDEEKWILKKKKNDSEED